MRGQEVCSRELGRTISPILPSSEKNPPLCFGIVVHAEYRGGYQIFLRFDDGLEGIVDFSEWLWGPVFEPLKDLEYFRRFYLDGDTVASPNGADIAPETLYEKARENAGE